jgi:hypothetical protein
VNYKCFLAGRANARKKNETLQNCCIRFSRQSSCVRGHVSTLKLIQNSEFCRNALTKELPQLFVFQFEFEMCNWSTAAQPPLPLRPGEKNRPLRSAESVTAAERDSRAVRPDAVEKNRQIWTKICTKWRPTEKDIIYLLF